MKASDIISIFKQMLKDKWGYVYGASGEMWTENNAQKYPETKKWVGHRVADCSGAFVYAFKKFNISVYHGSNRLARVYTKQLISIDDVKEGMIVFKGRLPGTELYRLPNDYKVGGKFYNGDLTDYYHCGLYVDGKVINLQSVETGCVSSDIKSWSCCGYLKDVSYFEDEASSEKIEISPDLAKKLYEELKCYYEK